MRAAMAGGHDPSRSKRLRAKLRHAALTRLPLRLSRGKLIHARSQTRLHIEEPAVPVQQLHPSLDGLRITHVSDLHIGELIPASRLPDFVRIINDLKGDLIAITGDLIDLNLKVLDNVIDALHELEAPLGVYLVPGNHDYLHNQADFVRRIKDAGLNLLVNETCRVEIEDTAIDVAGIDYAHKRSRIYRDVRRTCERLSDSDASLRLLLAHHPHAFDHAPDYGVDLTLSGHTHGGQVKWPNGRRKKLANGFGLGNLSFRYPHGLYERNGSHLYVTSGIGSWFPLRLNCPAEVVQLTLRSAEN